MKFTKLQQWTLIYNQNMSSSIIRNKVYLIITTIQRPDYNKIDSRIYSFGDLNDT